MLLTVFVAINTHEVKTDASAEPDIFDPLTVNVYGHFPSVGTVNVIFVLSFLTYNFAVTLEVFALSFAVDDQTIFESIYAPEDAEAGILIVPLAMINSSLS